MVELRRWPSRRSLSDELSGGVFEALRDHEFFKRFTLNPDFHTLQWPKRKAHFAGPVTTTIIVTRMERMTVEQIAEEALALPSEARAQLADRLVESLDPAEDGYIRQLWAAEALRRRDDVRSGRVEAIPGEEALARVRNSVGR